jgi:hypothetical protein
MKFEVDLDADSDPYAAFEPPATLRKKIAAILARLGERGRAILIDELSLFDPVVWCQAKLGMPLDPWQKVVLRTPGDVALLSGRRSGKSTIAAIRAAHRVYAATKLRQESTTLVVGPSLRQVVETMRVGRALLMKSLSKDDFDIDNKLSLEVGDARIVGLPSDAATGRGFTSDFAIIEESQSLTEPQEIIATIAPTLATTQGSLWMIGTCFDTNDPLHAVFEGDANLDPRWTRFRILSRWCPRISRAWLSQQRLLLGDALFEREYECRWTAPQHGMFDEALLQGALLPDAFDMGVGSFGATLPPAASAPAPTPPAAAAQPGSSGGSLDAAIANAVLP